MFEIPSELRVHEVNGSTVLSINGQISESTVMSLCERMDLRFRTRASLYKESTLDLTNKALNSISVGHLIRCIDRNQIRPKIVLLCGSHLNDFDLHNAIGSYIESVSGRFISELDISDNQIGDFGLITILQSMVTNKLNSSDKKISIVRINNNLITHPARILQAIPPNLQYLVYASGGFMPQAAMADALIYLYGLEDQRVPRAKRDVDTQHTTPPPSARPRGQIQEPDSDD